MLCRRSGGRETTKMRHCGRRCTDCLNTCFSMTTGATLHTLSVHLERVTTPGHEWQHLVVQAQRRARDEKDAAWRAALRTQELKRLAKEQEEELANKAADQARAFVCFCLLICLFFKNFILLAAVNAI